MNLLTSLLEAVFFSMRVRFIWNISSSMHRILSCNLALIQGPTLLSMTAYVRIPYKMILMRCDVQDDGCRMIPTFYMAKRNQHINSGTRKAFLSQSMLRWKVDTGLTEGTM